MKYAERLKLAARELSREVVARRAQPNVNPLALAIYEARLSAVTHARREWTAWLRANPNAHRADRNRAKRTLGLPVTRRECLQQIARIHQEVVQRFSRCE